MHVFRANVLVKLVKDRRFRVAVLREFLDVSQFQVGDEEESEHHGGQGHVVHPQAPGGVLYSQVVKVLLAGAPGTDVRLRAVTHSSVKIRQKQQVFSRQACRVHAAAVRRRRRQAAVSCHGLLAKRQTHKLVDLYGLNKEIARAQNQRRG